MATALRETMPATAKPVFSVNERCVSDGFAFARSGVASACTSVNVAVPAAARPAPPATRETPTVCCHGVSAAFAAGAGVVVSGAVVSGAGGAGAVAGA